MYFYFFLFCFLLSLHFFYYNLALVNSLNFFMSSQLPAVGAVDTARGPQPFYFLAPLTIVLLHLYCNAHAHILWTTCDVRTHKMYCSFKEDPQYILRPYYLPCAATPSSSGHGHEKWCNQIDWFCLLKRLLLFFNNQKYEADYVVTLT